MFRWLAALSLLLCLAVPFLFFWGHLSDGAYRTWFALTSLAWFVLATLAMSRSGGGRQSS